jgi:hypothetical protein
VLGRYSSRSVAFKGIVEARGDFRIAAVDNIARYRPMVDTWGNPLASFVFGWSDKESEWWKTALSARRTIDAAISFQSRVRFSEILVHETSAQPTWAIPVCDSA